MSLCYNCYMQEKIDAFKQHVREAAANPEFVHHRWFVQWHLEIVDRIALELLGYYPEADPELVEVMVWLHDYGKILDFDNQYEMTLSAGKEKLTELGFEPAFVQRAVENIATLDRKMTEALESAPIEVQIVSSADGCSHMVGPFMSLWWYENSGKTHEELLADTEAKLKKDWERKIVLPEARAAFEQRHKVISEQSGNLPEKFL